MINTNAGGSPCIFFCRRTSLSPRIYHTRKIRDDSSKKLDLPFLFSYLSLLISTVMKAKHSLLFLLSFIFYLGSAQVPQGFNYQAVARDEFGNLLQGTTLQVMLYIQSSPTGGTIFWKELHNPVVTNTFGLFTVVLGTGVRQGASTVATFDLIDWKVIPKYVKTEIYYSGSWKNMGNGAQLWTVPYAMTAQTAQTAKTAQSINAADSIDIKGTSTNQNAAIFEVKNKDGQTVFAVYNEGVRIWVSDGAKGSKGGFAVGGFDQTKTWNQEYLRVTSDSTRIYVNNNAGKGQKGGFAVGGYDQTKGTIQFLNVAIDDKGVLNPSENRVLWYPVKNAFLVGRVLVESPDSVGLNSFVSGYESQASGDWSQALGFNTSARGDYSTAIGKNSIAAGANAFAFGDSAKALGPASYSFGTRARATGDRSFAFGSVGYDSTGALTGPTIASGVDAFALGLGSVASGKGSFTFGMKNLASGPFSLAMGYGTKSDGWFSTTTGICTNVEDWSLGAMANGIWTKAGNWAASAFGDRTYASGHTSFATGFMTNASGQLSSTFGDQTDCTILWLNGNRKI